MKKSLLSFLSGVLVTTLVCSLTVSALAISGRMSIEVDPVNIQVNGQVFTPKNANGEAVPVFAYNGTTYAPLRALAEAYGLEVGYDAQKNMATVVDPANKTVTDPKPDTEAPVFNWSDEEEAAYQEFKGMWEVRSREEIDGIKDTDFFRYIAWYTGDKQLKEYYEWLADYGEETLDKFTSRTMVETLGGKNGNLSLRYSNKYPSIFGMQIVNGEISKVADSIFHNGLVN